MSGRSNGQAVVVARWRALDREGTDHCRLSRASDGWMLVGHARFRDAGGFAALDYVLRCDTGWRTLGADIAGEHGGRKVQLHIAHEDGYWLLNETAQPGLAEAVDLDLSFTPSTNLMPLRRLMTGGQDRLEPCAAWLRYPDPALTLLEQSYSVTGSRGVIAYSASQTGFACELIVDASGFVTRYPGYWEGEISHEG